MVFSRRSVLASLAIGAATPRLSWGQVDESDAAAYPFSFEWLKSLAREMAGRPHTPGPPPPRAVQAIDYDAFGEIRFRPERAIWGGQDGSLRLFSLNSLVRTPVEINIVSEGVARPLTYSPGLFQAPVRSPFHDLPQDSGFGGFRLMRADGTSDWLAFLGASYFRSSHPFDQYGLSARGLAVDTAATTPEEFPVFTRFWIERDPQGDVVVHALMDSPGVVGAYRIANHRPSTAIGAPLVQEIEAAVFLRRDIEQIGFAPLTSMFWYGEDRIVPAEDWRPEVHDSDGLEIWNGAGERLWRPLSNQNRIVTSVFSDENPRGFGLMQRDRNFSHYQDDGVFYERRPSLWVEPLHPWGRGSVRLVEIPTRTETEDNIVAFWTPEAPMKAGAALSLRYRLHWTARAPVEMNLARVTSTRSGRVGHPGEGPGQPGRRIAIDFQGESLEGLRGDSGVEAVVTGRRGEISNVFPYPVIGSDRTWRVVFDVIPSGSEPADLRAFLRQGHRTLSETWTNLVFDRRAERSG